MRISQKTRRNSTGKKMICRIIMKIFKRNKEDFPKKDEDT